MITEARKAYIRDWKQRHKDRVLGHKRAYIDDKIDVEAERAFHAMARERERKRRNRAARAISLADRLRAEINDLCNRPFSWQVKS